MSPAIPMLALFALLGFAVLFWLFLSASFLLWGARLAGIERRSFGRAIGTIILGGIATSILAFLLSASPLVGTGLGVLLGFCVSALVMMSIFDTTFGKALAANILAWVLSIVVTVALAFIGLFVLGILFAVAP